MSGFKLLAIRPIKGCDENFRKRLKDGLVYKFFQDYEFLDENGDEISIQQNNLNSKIVEINSPKEELDLYSDGDLKINVSAVVGENGSGKSSLIELFFLAVFLKSVKSNALNISKEIKETRKNTRKIDEQIRGLEDRVKVLQIKTDEDKLDFRKTVVKIDALRKEREWLNHHVDSLDEASKFSKNNKVYLEIYFKIGKEIRKISFYPRGFKNKSKIDEFIVTKKTITEFFYTISLNYSLYGLNALEMGKWIERLFHKNDGYLTPVVINPMRTNGKIDINIENYLGQNRILANLVDKKLHQIQIIDGKEIDEIQFKLPSRKLENHTYYFTHDPPFFDEELNDSTAVKFVKIEEGSQGLFDKKLHIDVLSFFEIGSDISISLNGVDPKLVREYVSQKLFKIARTYSDYSSYFLVEESGKEVINDFAGFAKQILEDFSHKTLKIRQLTNVLRYGILANKDSTVLETLYDIKTKSGLQWSEGKFRMHFTRYAKIINYAYNRALKEHKKGKKPELIEFIPNAFFEPLVSFKNEGGFRALSSGEQQYFNALNTIVYHILNLDSIQNHYSRVNVIFDEIELYFHPEFQRRFISDLLRAVKNLRLENVKELNIIFSTHSPFILSDIPSSNILRLKKGEPKPNSNQTFGANIHDLLANDFFLDKGFMGAFSKKTIEIIIKNLQSELEFSEEDQKKMWDTIELIGEDVLRNSLISLYQKKFKVPNYQELLDFYNKNQHGAN